MNIKNNKGITLLVLIITVIVLIILAGTAITVSMGIGESAQFQNIKTSLLIIQSKCKVLSNKKAIGEIDEEELYGTKQEEGEYAGYYLLSKGDLYDMGLKDINAEDKYYINYEDNEVAYGKGITVDNVTYHKLSEMNKKED